MAIPEVERSFISFREKSILPAGLPELLTPPQKILEVTPANIADLFRQKKFADFSWLPFFSGNYAYGPILSSELSPNEKLVLIIPEMVVEQRVAAFVKKIAPYLLKDPQSFALGALLDGGYHFYQRVLAEVTPQTVWGDHTFPAAHADVKSHWSTPSGKEEVKALPSPDLVNGKNYLIFEGVIDSIGTINLLRESLAVPPFHPAEVIIISLTDKLGARTPEQQTLPPNTSALLGLGGFWMCGDGPDANNGRFRTLPGGGIARYSKN